MSIDLPAELVSFVKREVSLGHYQSEQEMVCQALELLRSRNAHANKLREAVDAGLASIERGDFIDLPDEAALRTFFDDIKARGRQSLAEQQGPNGSPVSP